MTVLGGINQTASPNSWNVDLIRDAVKHTAYVSHVLGLARDHIIYLQSMDVELFASDPGWDNKNNSGSDYKTLIRFSGNLRGQCGLMMRWGVS